MSNSQAAKPGILDGVRVLDFTAMMSGPYCTRLMADLGAEVIKVEPPEGDYIRLRAPRREGRSTYFAQLNAGKKSLALDLKKPEAIALIREMVAKCDVVVENYRPGVMKRLGLDYESLSALNPKLVYCSISGFGQDGSWAGRSAYAPVLHAASGYDMANLDYQEGDVERPLKNGIFVADVLGGSLAFGGIQAALVQRARTGKGDYVDLSLLDSMMSLLVCEVQEAQFPEQPLHFVYKPTPARDGYLVVAPTTQDNFVGLCKATGHLEWLDDERFATGRARQSNWDVFLAELAKWALQHSAEECERILDAHHVPCSRYLDITETMQLSVVKERGTMCEIDDGGGQDRKSVV